MTNTIITDEAPMDFLKQIKPNLHSGIIDQFVGPNRFLSNFTAAQVQINDWVFSTVEHAYQAAKSNNPFDWKRIQDCSTPGSAKRMGQKLRIRKDWDEVKVQCMYGLLQLKFQIPHLREQLVATGDYLLIEGNSWNDTFWGVSLDTGKGQNNLGILLMKVRSEINKIPENRDFSEAQETQEILDGAQ
jgi:ribA/ribD-fused uncharacterized protein